MIRQQRVIIESPFSGKSGFNDVQKNIKYARACVHDSLLRGESPYASHLLYTQPGVLDDDKPEERMRGIYAGESWRQVADVTAFYTDAGWSAGMLAALAEIFRDHRRLLFRALDPDRLTLPTKEQIKTPVSLNLSLFVDRSRGPELRQLA